MNIQKVIMKLLLLQPFYGHLATSLSIVENKQIPTLKAVYSPSLSLHYNSQWFNELDNETAQWVIIHELLHMTLLHPLRRQDRDIMLWEVACDISVNCFIPSLYLDDKSVTLEKVIDKTGARLEKRKSAEYYYSELLKLQDGIALFDNGEQISIKIGSSQELIINKQSDDISDADQVSTKTIKEKLNSLLKSSLEEGTAPNELSEQYEQIYHENSVDWRNVFKRFLIGRGRIESRRSYKKDSRRYSGFPGNKRSVGLKCLLAIDESGSVSDNQISGFYNEIIGINRITNADIFVTRFDTTCTEPVRIVKADLSVKRTKSGGTDFRPIFQMADKMCIDMLVIFTDGDGIAPEYVNQRVLWVLTKGGKCPVSYGFAVELN